MERGTPPLSHFHHSKSTSEFNMDQQTNPSSSIAVATGNDNNKSNVVVQPQPCTAREQDQYMPIANVIRIMRRILPAHAKISDDAKETIQECVSEYISFVTGEANERCQREQRKTITAEDVLWAMGKLGFDDYVDPLTIFINRYREFESDRGCSLRVDSSFKPAFGGPGIGLHGPLHGPINSPLHGPLNGPLNGPSLTGPYGYGMYDQSTMMGGGRYYPNGSGQDGFQNPGAAGGSSSNSTSGNGMPSFDPYGQYKQG